MRLTTEQHDSLALPIKAGISPGPWAALPTGSGGIGIYSMPLHRVVKFEGKDFHEGLVALVYGHYDKEGNSSSGPNHALIAAAPALLGLAQQYASECAECDGTGLISRSFGGDGFGDRCAALADADDQPCPQCEDIRAVLALATGGAR